MPNTQNRSVRSPRRSPSQWRTIFNRFEQSGKTIKDFCHQENLSQATFNKWCGRLRQETGLPGFVELQSVTDPSSPAKTWSIHIDLPGGGHLHIQVEQ